MQVVGNERISSHASLLFVDTDTSPLDFKKVGLTSM